MKETKRTHNAVKTNEEYINITAQVRFVGRVCFITKKSNSY